ncbi:UNVERIFIED_CONTAM: hypothetical protein NCL1_28771 [Trichonephila clavipes]
MKQQEYEHFPSVQTNPLPKSRGSVGDTSARLQIHQSIADTKDVETWMPCDAEDCGFQMLNDDEIVTSVQEESDPVDDETDEDEDNTTNCPVSYTGWITFGFRLSGQS